MVIARADQHHRVLGEAQRRERDCRGSVLGRRLDNDPCAGCSRELILDMRQMRRACHHHGRREAGFGRATSQCSLE